MNIELTMRLLREGVTPEQALKEESQFEFKACTEIPDAKFYLGRAFQGPPEWLDFIKPFVEDIPAAFENQGVGGILFVPVPDTTRTMVVCFGYGHIELDLDCFERQFGLRVTLNKVPPNSLKSLELAVPDTVTFSRRIQASKVSEISKFKVDYDRDLAFTASGKPKDKDFAMFLSGNDGLKIRCLLAWDELPAKCLDVYNAFCSMDYKTNGFDWIDHIQLVRQEDLIFKLDQQLVAALNKARQGEDSSLHLCIPEQDHDVHLSKVHINGLGIRGNQRVFSDVTLESYLSLLHGDLDLKPESIKEFKSKHKAKIFSDNGPEKELRIYDSLIFETKLDEKYYILFRSKWYAVDVEFAQAVDSFFQGVDRINIVPATSAKNEQDLIKALASRADLVLVDRNTIRPSKVKGQGNTVEPCDFYSKEGYFIHLKNGDASSSISHLWSQGVVSAECFLNDTKYRSAFRKYIKTKKAGFLGCLPKDGKKVNTSMFTVIYGVMRKPTYGKLDLPFFSKVSLRTSVQQIQNMGYKVAINLIEKTTKSTSKAA